MEADYREFYKYFVRERLEKEQKMDSKTLEHLKRFNLMWAHMSEAYKNIDYSASKMCLYYLLEQEDAGEEATQKGLCAAWLMNKQTANSAVKRLLQADYITIEVSQRDKREKILKLTEEGRKAAYETALPVREAELRAFQKFPEKERECLMQLMEILVENLKEELVKIE